MPVRLIQVIAEEGHADAIAAVAEEHRALHFRVVPGEDDARVFHILAHPEGQQELIDRLQFCLDGAGDWRIAILPVDATIPEPETDGSPAAGPDVELRERLYEEISRGARMDVTFFLLVALSTVVATIGLLNDRVEVVIAGMVIAPLLGPNMALPFASVLGERSLIARAAAASAIGFGLSVAGAALAGVLLPSLEVGPQLMARTRIGYDDVALALASGAAGALSLLTRLSGTLVGVMVAVAMLPPAAALGWLLGSAHFSLAGGAGALLAVNVVCVNLAAQVVFLANGIKPRTWLEQRAAQQSTVIGIAASVVLLAALLVVIYLDRA